MLDKERADRSDAEELDEEETVTPESSSKSKNNALEKRDGETLHDGSPSNVSSSSHAVVKEVTDSPTSTTDPEQGSSMEGSDKNFSFLDASEESDKNASADSSILIGEAVVSVVTTKSVVNGTISVPTTFSPSTTSEQVVSPPLSSSSSSSFAEITTDHPVTEVITTEDSSRVLASVQTSRSVSGARFLPFPVIDRVEQVEHGGGSLDGKKTSQSPSESTESIIDKLDWAQSKLSSDLLPAAILGGGFRNAGNTLQLDVLAERERGTTRRRFTTTIKTPIISKFVPRRYNDKRLEARAGSSTAKPRPETTLDNLESLLPRDYTSKGITPSTESSKINFRSDIYLLLKLIIIAMNKLLLPRDTTDISTLRSIE